MKTGARAVISLFLLVILVGTGGYAGKENTTVLSMPSVPMEVNLSISSAPALNETAQLICTITSVVDAPNTTAQITLPEGFELISGNLSWHGDIVANGQESFNVVIKSVKTGIWTIEAGAGYPIIPYDWCGASDYLFISVSEDTALVSKEWFSSKQGWEPAQRLDDIMELNLSISNTPALNETAEVTCTVVSSAEAPHARIRIYFNQGLELVAGDLEWTGNITKDMPVQLRATIKPIKTGTWCVGAEVLPPCDEGATWASVDDYLYITAAEDSATVSYTAPVSSSRGMVEPEAIPLDGAQRIQAAALSNPLTVTGSIECYISEDSIPTLGQAREDVLKPLIWGGVYVYREDGVLLNFSLSGAQGSTMQGKFAITVENPYPKGFYVGFIPLSGAAFVYKPDGSEYWSYTPIFYPGPSDTKYDVGNRTILPDDKDYRGAWRIYETIVNDAYDRGAWDFLANEIGWIPPRGVNVYFKMPEGSGTKFNQFNNTIYIDHYTFSQALDAVQHEYGHWVMYRVYNDSFPPSDYPGGEHYMYKAYGPNCAWIEGWAEFFPLAAQSYNRWNDPVFEWGWGAMEGLETPTCGTPNWENGDIWEDGDNVEGRVAGALWDIFDSADDGYDTFSDGFLGIWDVMRAQTDNNFAEFYNAWKSRGHNKSKFLLAAYQNTINYCECSVTNTSCGCPSGNCTNCNSQDGWYEVDSYSCCQGDRSCTCEDWEYRDFYCAQCPCPYAKCYEIPCIYVVTATRTDTFDCVNCNNNDGCYPYGNGCEYRDYYCSGGSCKYTPSNRHTDYYENWTYYCKGDEVWKHRLLHDFYCEGGTCQDHTSWVDDQLVENCTAEDGWYCNATNINIREYRDYYCSGGKCAYNVTSSENCSVYDGWVDTGNTQWVNDPANQCKEKEQKEQEYWDYTCSGSSCTHSITNTRWVDTGNTRNKADGAVCGADYYEDWVYYCNGDEVWKHRLLHDFCCEGGTCQDHTSWVDDQLAENCSDGWYCNATNINIREYRDYYCSGGECAYNVTSSENCSDYDGWYCNATNINIREYRDYYCSGGECAYNVTSSENCSDYDGWYSNGDTMEYRDYHCSGGSCCYTVIPWVTGTTREVNCSILSNVTVQMYRNGTLEGIATSDVNGSYVLLVPEDGTYNISASKEGFRNETCSLSITEPRLYTLNFSGDNGLVPNIPSLSYLEACGNHWLYPPGAEVKWVSPTGQEDPDNKWTEESYAYDENTNSEARVFEKNHYLELTHSALTCARVRIYAVLVTGGLQNYADPNISIDVYYGGAWHNIFSGTIPKFTWVEKTFPKQSITKARIKSNDELSTYPYVSLHLGEFDFGTDTCALAEWKVGDVLDAWLHPIGEGAARAGPPSLPSATIVARDIPPSVERGTIFNVTVTFTAPGDEFNWIGLTDFAPEGWNTTINTAQCTPEAKSIKTTGNKTEIVWQGAYANNTNFTAVYQVTVPENTTTTPGYYIFGNGFLEYYINATGPYKANITGESGIKVTLRKPIVVRDMPSWVKKGETFNVTVIFATPEDGFTQLNLRDIVPQVPQCWGRNVSAAWCSPTPNMINTTSNGVQIIWNGPYVKDTRFTVVYQVTVWQNAAPGEYTFGSGNLSYRTKSGLTSVDITGKSNVTVWETLITGVVRGLNTSLMSNVTVQLYKNGTLEGNATSALDGNYVLLVPELGDYVVNISKKGFTNEPLYENKSISVTEGKRYTLNFSGEYGLMPNAPNGLYCIKCSNAWLYGDWYPPEQALSMWSVKLVLWYWTHPQNDPPSERGGNESVSGITVVRDIPSRVERGETFNVTMTFTAPEDDFNSILLADFAHEGWDTAVNVTRCSPEAGYANIMGNEVDIVWEKSFSRNTSFTAVYQVTVPMDASPGNYTFGEGFLEHYINVTGPYVASVTGESEITVGEGVADVTGAGVYPAAGAEARQITGTAASSVPTVVRDMPSEVGRGETFNATVTFTSPESGFEFLVLTDFAPESWEAKFLSCTPANKDGRISHNKIEAGWNMHDSELQEFQAVYNVTVPEDAPAGIHTFGKGDIKYFLAPGKAYRAWIGGASEVTVVNYPPITDIGGPYTGDEGSPITLNGSASYAPNGTIVSYEWDLDNDGEFDDATGAIVSHTWDDDYNGTISLKVTDNAGASSIASTTVTVLNVPPVVDAGPDQTVQFSDQVKFTGCFTDSGIFDSHTILWDFGDGTSLTGTGEPGKPLPTCHHSYPQPGIYNVTLTVTDNDGGVGLDSCTVTIIKESVVIKVDNTQGSFNDTVTLKAHVRDDDGHPLLNGPWEASFKVGDVEVGNATISETGDAQIKWQVSLIPTKPKETYPIVVSFAENPYYRSAKGNGNFTLNSAKGLTQDIVTQLEELEKKAGQDLILDAIRFVNRSLDDRLWEDSSRLNPKMMSGALVFDEHKAAVLKLKSAESVSPRLSADIEAVIGNLSEVDRLLTVVGLEDAKSIEVKNWIQRKLVDMEIAKAEYELQKADRWLDKDRPDLAINSYKLAWMYAQVAIKLGGVI